MHFEYVAQLNEDQIFFTANIKLIHVHASERRIQGFGGYLPVAISASQLRKDQRFQLLHLNIVTLQVFFDIHFPQHFERVFRCERAKLGTLDSSACTRHTELRGHIRYRESSNNFTNSCIGLRDNFWKTHFVCAEKLVNLRSAGLVRTLCHAHTAT